MSDLVARSLLERIDALLAAKRARGMFDPLLAEAAQVIKAQEARIEYLLDPLKGVTIVRLTPPDDDLEDSL